MAMRSVMNGEIPKKKPVDTCAATSRGQSFVFPNLNRRLASNGIVIAPFMLSATLKQTMRRFETVVFTCFVAMKDAIKAPLKAIVTGAYTVKTAPNILLTDGES